MSSDEPSICAGDPTLPAAGDNASLELPKVSAAVTALPSVQPLGHADLAIAETSPSVSAAASAPASGAAMAAASAPASAAGSLSHVRTLSEHRAATSNTAQSPVNDATRPSATAVNAPEKAANTPAPAGRVPENPPTSKRGAISIDTSSPS